MGLDESLILKLIKVLTFIQNQNQMVTLKHKLSGKKMMTKKEKENKNIVTILCLLPDISHKYVNQAICVTKSIYMFFASHFPLLNSMHSKQH